MHPTKQKLNMGSGKSTVAYKHLRDEYWNVDIRPYKGVDEVADMRTAEYPDESFIHILCSDALDHVTFTDAKKVLRKFYRWLKPNGTLRIHLPNLRKLARILALADDEEALMWLYGTNGEGSTDYDSNIIRWAYSKDSLRKLLLAQGFEVLSMETALDGWRLVVIAVKR